MKSDNGIIQLGDVVVSKLVGEHSRCQALGIYKVNL
jgi:hypothetical protein